MKASSTAERHSASLGLTMPPWLWVWLAGDLLASMPKQISEMHSDFVTYFSHVSFSTQVTGQGFVPVERFSVAFGALVYAVMVAGVVAVMFPHLRGRWVERRFKLATDTRDVITEMQQFVDAHDSSIQLRVSIRADQMARIYPVGWRSARIAVFRPLTVLWHRDREAAQAVLLHEVAHRRQGDQLIVGLGSPFVWLIRIWAPAYLLLVVIPTMVYLAAGGGPMTSLVGLGSAVDALTVPAEIIVPITALWLAELSADQMAAQAIGSDALRRALRATAGSRVSLVARVTALLSHPPRWMRLRRGAARPTGSVALLAAWPTALVTCLVIFPVAVAAVALPLLYSFLSPLLDSFPPGFARSEMDSTFRLGVHATLVDSRPVVIATAVVLLAWPFLAVLWERLWSSGPRPGQLQPWWPCLAAAGLPVGILLLSLAPLQAGPQKIVPASLPRTTQEPPQSACSQINSWVFGGGLTEPSRAATAFSQLAHARDSKRAMAADAQRVDAAIRAALDNPPPGAAQPSYDELMTDYRTATQDMQADNFAAAAGAMDDAARSYTKAIALIVDEMKGHCNYPSLPTAPPPG